VVPLLRADGVGGDAAILFADILLVLEPMGVGLEFASGDGPIIHRPVRSAADVDRLERVPATTALSFVLDTVRCVQERLAGRVPLIGFAARPSRWRRTPSRGADRAATCTPRRSCIRSRGCGTG
jgi:uroporphyrinogen decarboxylase